MSAHATVRASVLVTFLGLAGATPLAAQDTSPPPLRLGDLQARAISVDPRTRQAELQDRASALRDENLRTERLPRLLLRGDASYQSEVIGIPIPGSGIEPPPKERWEAALDTDWTLWDGGLVGARRTAEQARLAATLAGLEAELYGLRMEVADAFFGALLLQEQIRESRLLAGDLDARLAELRDRVEVGAALPGDTATLRAERLGVEQRILALESERRISLRILGRLVDLTIDEGRDLALPELDALFASATPAATDSRTGAPESGSLRLHPRFQAIQAERDVRSREMSVLRALRRPTVSAFGSVAFGSPGFDQFNTDPHEFWRAGIRVQWQPWEWRRTARQEEELQLAQRILDTRESEFARRLDQALEAPLGRIAYLDEALRSDTEIVGLREVAETQARVQFEERVISAAVYADARSDVQEARIARIRHRIERARAQAHYLITLGVELPES